MRSAALRAASQACADAQSIAVLVPGDTDEPLTAWSLRGLGLDIGDGPPVPLAVAIAGWLLAGRPAHVLGTQVAADRLQRFDAVLAMGDGSAARTDKAPLHVDPRATVLDELCLAALERGHLQTLRTLDLAEQAAVGATGPAVWATVATLVEQVDDSVLLAQADPYGVQYLVAMWHGRWADPA